MAQTFSPNTTYARLSRYALFDDEVLGQVRALEEVEADYATYTDLFAAYGVPLQPSLYTYRKRRTVSYVDVAPRKKADGRVLVLHLPMNNPLDTNQLYHVAMLAAALPKARIIAFGNPSGAPYRYKGHRFSLSQWLGVATAQNTQPVVEGELAYLKKQGIQQVHHVGYSFGAAKALLAAQHGDDIRAKGVIILDPVAHPRPFKQLVEDFFRSAKPLGHYVDRTNSPRYAEARRDALRLVKYRQGLYRPVNLALAFMLSRLDVVKLLESLLYSQSFLRVFVAWGGKSEVGNDAHLKASLHELAYEVGVGRLRRARLADEYHAFANDAYLHVAVVLQALRNL